MQPQAGTSQAALPPHDIVGLSPMAPPYAMWALYLLIALAIGVLASYLYRKWRQKPQVTKEIVRQKPLDPSKALVDKLRTLEPKEPFARQQKEEFFYELSMVLRGFIEWKTRLKATDMTFEEIEKTLAMERTPLSDEQVHAALSFLKKADQIKFAREEVGIVEAEKDKELVLSFARTLAGRMLA